MVFEHVPPDFSEQTFTGDGIIPVYSDLLRFLVTAQGSTMKESEGYSFHSTYYGGRTIKCKSCYKVNHFCSTKDGKKKKRNLFVLKGDSIFHNLALFYKVSSGN